MQSKPVTPTELSSCLDVLDRLLNEERLAELSTEDRVRLLRTAGRLSRPSKDEQTRRNKAIAKQNRKRVSAKDREARAKTGIRDARVASVFVAPTQVEVPGEAPGDLINPRNCYVCKAEFKKLHFFYDSMCPPCAELNYKKRFQSARLDGQVALITGSRLKIGYHVTLMMLRAGARVIATTRFPVDSALRFSREEDYGLWKDRLEIHGLDLRHTPSIEIFTRYVEQTAGRLDILINNAAQTVRRPSGFFAHLMENERRPISQLPKEVSELLRAQENCRAQIDRSKLEPTNLPAAWAGPASGVGLRASAELSQLPFLFDDKSKSEDLFPTGRLDVDLQQVDLRTTNSWRMKLADVPAAEMLEVQLVNAVAPFVLCSRLAPLMRRDPTGRKHIVNVTAMEGKFHRFKKADRHPHTNMAKAALNMLTHTSASDLAKDGIFMNAVDTGWVTDEDPAGLVEKKQDVHDFQPPLDIVDGAARICDPFFDGILTGTHWCGKFLKDYFPIDW